MNSSTWVGSASKLAWTALNDPYPIVSWPSSESEKESTTTIETRNHQVIFCSAFVQYYSTVQYELSLERPVIRYMTLLSITRQHIWRLLYIVSGAIRGQLGPQPSRLFSISPDKLIVAAILILMESDITVATSKLLYLLTSTRILEWIWKINSSNNCKV